MIKKIFEEAIGVILKSIIDILRSTYYMGLQAASYIKIKMGRFDETQLEVGSGPNKRSGWITLDICKGADIYWDLRFKTPFKDSSFDRIYCSHVLEHFSYNDLKAVLREMHRILRPNGEFMISVPDASIYVSAYLGKRNSRELMQYKPAVPSEMPMDVLNYIFYMDGHHKFMFDAQNLIYHCKAAGFNSCVQRPFDQSLDMAARDYESLYMSCRKEE